NDVEERVVGSQAQQRPHQRSRADRDEQAGNQRSKDLDGATDQARAVHAQDAADNNAANIEIKEVAGPEEVLGRRDDRFRQEMRIDQVGRKKRREDRSSADV